MTDQASPEGVATPISDANASPVVQTQADAGAAQTNGSEAESSPAAPDTQGDQQPEKKGIAKRIDELTRRYHSAERAHEQTLAINRELVGILKNLGIGQQAVPPQQPGQPAQPQNPLDPRTINAAVTEKVQEFIEQQNWEATREAFDEKAKEFAKTHDDFFDVFHDGLPITKAMGAEIAEADNSAELAYFLGNNPEILDRLSKLPPSRMGAEIAKIDARLGAEAKKAKERAVSKAPPPAPNLKASEPAMNVKASSPDSDKLSTDAWMKARNRELRNKD